jgi:transposase InsO family protein
VKYAWIYQNQASWPIRVMCKVLGVSTSGYFAYFQRQNDAKLGKLIGKRLNTTVLLARIREVHTRVKGEYGWPRMWKALKAQSLAVGKERVRKLMQQNGLYAKAKRRFVVTTDSKHTLPTAPNLLERCFTPEGQDQIWAGDITYIDTAEGWLYLAVVIDLFSRRVVGWAMSHRMKSELVCDALRMALFRRRPKPGLIFHSDQGSQYCSKLFEDLRNQHGVVASMSRKGDCWDNAPTESLWGRLKVGRLYKHAFETRREAMDEVIDWLNFYNSERLHSTLGYISPMQFEAKWLAAQQPKAA